MASGTLAPDRTSTDEQFEKKIEEEANGQESVSLHNENEEKHDKAEDAQDQATISSKTEGEEKKAEPAVAAVEKVDSSPSSSEALVSDNLKEEKELIPDTQTVSVTEPAPEAAKSMPEESPPAGCTESTEKEEEKQPKTAEIPEPSVETAEKLSSTVEANPPAESEAEVVKETENLETCSKEVDKPEPVVTEVQEKAEEPEKESQDRAQEAEQPNAGAISDSSVETNEKPHDAIEKPEPIVTVTEVQERPEEQEKEYQEKPQEAEQQNTVAVSGLSAETNGTQGDVTENHEPVVTKVQETLQEPEEGSQEKPHEAEQPETVEVPDSGPLAETNKKPSDAILNPEPLVTQVHEKSEEIQTESGEKPQDNEQPTIVATADSSAKTSEKLSDAIEEKTKQAEFDAEASKETDNYEAGPTETEKAKPVVAGTMENPSEPEKQSLEKEEEEEQQKTVIHQTASESAEKPGDKVDIQPPQESDIEVVKGTGNSNLEAVAASEEKQELVKSRETSDEIINEPISLKEEKTDKAEETSITGNSAQVSSNEEAQAVAKSPVESSPAAAEKAVQEACTNEVEEVSKEVDGALKDPEQASINQKAKAELKEEGEYSARISVEEKVAANEDKKQVGAPEESSREAEVEIGKVEEQNGAKTATREAGDAKTQNVTDERTAFDNEKQGQPVTKVDEGATAVSEQVRETLASKLEEKEEESVKTGLDNMGRVQTEVQTPEPPTKESDATKTSWDIPKETPAKPAQKQSNNILSKVKQSLVKAKKAIIGKSPNSKTVSTEAKSDIKVK